MYLRISFRWIKTVFFQLPVTIHEWVTNIAFWNMKDNDGEEEIVPITQSQSELPSDWLTVPTISSCSNATGLMLQTWKIQAMKEQNENIGELFIWPPSWGEISKHTSKTETPKEKAWQTWLGENIKIWVYHKAPLKANEKSGENVKYVGWIPILNM